MTGPRRLSQAISEGDGISLVVAVSGPEEARQAEARGAEALLADGDVAAIRAACALPILTGAGSAGDARIVRPGDDDVELGDGVEVVVQVEREEELEDALEHLDPELFVLSARDVDEPLQHVLDLLSDLPAGKLAIADLGGVTQAQIDELERAGVDGVLVRDISWMGPERRSSIAIGVAVFIAGGALLGLEIASSRVLAPFFGNSLYVWGALIGVVLAGLSTGYWLGGAVADRYPTPRLLVGVLGVAGVLVLAIPFIDGWVLNRVVDWDPGPRLNPLIATILLFGVQSVVLGTASPVAVRLRARSIEQLGRTAGRLFAVSTAGSIAGTFATSFWLIPELGTDQVLASAAVALLLAAAAVALVERLVIAFALTLVVAGASVGAVVSLAPESGGTVAASQLRNWSPVYRRQAASGDIGGAEDDQTGYKIIHTKDSQYHRIAVVDDDTSRYLRFDSSFQSGMYLNDPYRTRFGYSDYLQLSFAYRPEGKRVLYIGLGGGSAPKRTWRDFPDVHIDAVELDPEVVDVAYKYFELPRDPRLEVEVEDGRRYVVANEGPWDTIVVDAFYSDSIPFHLATREFLELVRSRLAPGGTVVANIIGAVRGPDSRLFRSMLRTYRAVFPTVSIHPVLDSGGNDLGVIRNIILVAGDAAAPSKEFLLERWRDVRRRSPGAPDLTEAIRGRVDAPISTDDVPVLTDDYAPTDALLLLFD